MEEITDKDLKQFMEEGHKKNWKDAADGVIAYLRKKEKEDKGSAGEILVQWLQQGMITLSLMIQFRLLAENPDLKYNLKS